MAADSGRGENRGGHDRGYGHHRRLYWRGGYGERIAVGLALNDNQMLLAGAVPSALLALVTQGLFELAESALRRRGAT
jgi:hypothetical protein